MINQLLTVALMPLDRMNILTSLVAADEGSQKNAQRCGTVDYRVNGKGSDHSSTPKQAEAYMKSIEKEPVVSAWWSDLTPAERVDLHAAYNIAKEEGFSQAGGRTNQPRTRQACPTSRR